VSEVRREFSRRAFLGGAASATLVAVAVRYDPALAMTAVQDLVRLDERPDTAVMIEPASPVLSLTAERDSDLFLADFTFYGFEVHKTAKPTSLVATATQTSDNWIGVVVQLPPQAIGEADYSYPPVDASIPFDPTPVLSELSGPTRLAFTFTTGDAIPLPTMTVADLMDWSGWDLNVPVSAQAGSGYPVASQPTDIQTAIECPLALILAPVVDDEDRIILDRFSTQFTNRTVPFTSADQVTEVWQTNLSSTQSYVIDDRITTSSIDPALAVVWATDFGATTSATPWEYINYSYFTNIQ
jgi:hypothetical protein